MSVKTLRSYRNFPNSPRSVKHDQRCIQGLQCAVKVIVSQLDDIVGLYEGHEGNQQKDFEHVTSDDSRIQVLTSPELSRRLVQLSGDVDSSD